ncbi:MAG: laminin sub domain 2, partial [Thermoleophilia bacterium]|nr:laminin sub domain 2 [Thermoleophilia bacterium]
QGNIHTVGNVAWVRPTGPIGAYQLDARVTATDLGSGVDHVAFPAFGAGWTPAAAGNAAFTSPTPVADAYTRSITFTTPSSLTTPGLLAATAVDGAGNQSTTPFEVRLDATAPSGSAAAVTAGRQATPTVTVALTAGTEGALESGLGSWTLQYDTAPLANDTCGTFASSWAVVATGVGAAPANYAHDTTLDGSACFRYRLTTYDNVSNVAVSAASTNARRVDVTVPTVATTTPADGSAQSGTFTVGGTAVDAHSGIDHVTLTFIGPASGTICDPATLGGTSPNWTFGCAWNTSALPDGTYTVRAISHDRAGNVSATHDIAVNLDNQPPFIGFHSFTDSSPYTYWAGPVGTNDRIWFNPAAPAGTHSFDVHITASDLGSGVARVEFDGAGTGWTPGAAIATDTTAAATPAADSYTMTYSFDTTNPGLVDPPTLDVAAFDPANNPSYETFDVTADNVQPAGGGVTYADGFVPTTNVTVSIDTGTDGAGSGIASWALVRFDGSLSGATCTAWGATETSIATGLGAHVGTAADVVGDPGCFRYRLRVTDNVGNVRTYTSASEVRVDLTPPTGTIVLAPGTNPANQYLDSPTRLYVNTSAGHSGTFTATVNANAASGVLDVTFPTLAAGFTGAGVMPGPGPSFARTYSWVAGAGAPPAGTIAVAQSNSLGHVDLPFDVIADPTAPAGGTTTYASSFTTTTSVSVAYTIGTDGGSGIAGHQLERERGTLAAGACTWTGTWTPAGPANGPLTFNDATLAHADCYRYRVSVTDRVGNVGSTVAGPAIMVDTTAPTSATMEFVEHAADQASTHLAATDSIWYRNGVGTVGTPARFYMAVRAVDPESGTGAPTFPLLPGNWVVGASTPVAGGFQAEYGRWGTATEPGTVTAIVPNGAGLTTTISGDILEDNEVSSAPSWSIAYDHGFNITTSATV